MAAQGIMVFMETKINDLMGDKTPKPSKKTRDGSVNFFNIYYRNLPDGYVSDKVKGPEDLYNRSGKRSGKTDESGVAPGWGRIEPNFKRTQESGGTRKAVSGKTGQASCKKDVSCSDEKAPGRLLYFNAASEILALLLGISFQKAQMLLEKSGITSESAALPDVIADRLGRIAGLAEEHQKTFSSLLANTFEWLGKLEREVAIRLLRGGDNPGFSITLDFMRVKDDKTDEVFFRDLRQNIEQMKLKLENPEAIEQQVSALFSDGIIPEYLNTVKNGSLTGNAYLLTTECTEIEADKTAGPGIKTSIVKKVLNEERERLLTTSKANKGTSAVTEYRASIEPGSVIRNGSGLKTDAMDESEIKEPVFSSEIYALNARQSPLQGTDYAFYNNAMDKSPVNDAKPSYLEIIDQVVKKAKVILNGEKSEMIIDLKPEHLGKLCLKVTTERGLVTASFVAESQQVREVLETNMQLLKDSLEKQGLAVQNFSVSVGGNSSDQTWNNRMIARFYENGKAPDAFEGKVAPPEKVAAAIIIYDFYESTVNLTA